MEPGYFLAVIDNAWAMVIFCISISEGTPGAYDLCQMRSNVMKTSPLQPYDHAAIDKRKIYITIAADSPKVKEGPCESPDSLIMAPFIAIKRHLC